MSHLRQECQLRELALLPVVTGPAYFGTHQIKCSTCGLQIELEYVHDPEDEDMQVWETR